MNAQERRDDILELVKLNGPLRTRQLTQYFGVLHRTTNRDVLALIKQGLIDLKLDPEDSAPGGSYRVHLTERGLQRVEELTLSN